MLVDASLSLRIPRFTLKAFSLIIAGLLLSSVATGQVTHQHTYAHYTQVVTYPGTDTAKYYLLDRHDKEARFYNSDHTSFRTLNIPAVPGELMHFNWLSAQTFDTDGKLEYLVNYRDTATGKKRIRIYDHDQSVLLDTAGYQTTVKSSGRHLVLAIRRSNRNTAVFQLPGTQAPTSYLRPAPVVRIPNAVSDQFRVTLGQAPSTGIFTFRLYNRWGEVVRERLLPRHLRTFVVNTKTLIPGVYAYRLMLRDGRVREGTVTILE